MIKFVANQHIDKEKWDDCINKSVNGIIYAYSWYLDIVCDNWDALVEDDYEAVMPLCTGFKFGQKYVYQPVFTQQLGVFSKAILSEEYIVTFLNAIPAEIKYAELNLNTFNQVTGKDFHVLKNRTYELDLIKPYEKIATGYSENLKRNIRKSKASELTIHTNISPDSVIKLFRENKGKNLPHLENSHYQKLNRLIHTLIYKHMGQVWGVYDNKNQLCAGAFFISGNDKVIFIFSATNSFARQAGAMPMLIDTFIKKNARRNLVLDFEGSNDPLLARFYASWGAKECFYPRLVLNRMNLFKNIGFKLYKSFRG